MDVKMKLSGNTLTALIEGDIDHHNAKEIRESIDRKIEEESPELLELDFSKVQFMDSCGIGLIMGRYKLMHALDGNLQVINIPENIKKLIKLAGLASLNIIRE